jgi:NitT/TauT family transport system permease protein
MNWGVRLMQVAWPALALLVLWQTWIAAAHVSPVIAPSPAAVAVELVTHPLPYAQATVATAAVAVAGLAIGMSFAIVAAAGAWLTPVGDVVLTLPALVVQSTPIVALLPVLARLLGYGEPAVVASAAAITFLPTFVLVGAGLRRTPPGAGELFGVLGSSRWQRLTLLALPSAFPNMLTALRIAAANSVLAALVAEFLMGQTGLGNMLADAQSQLLTAQAWSASFVATMVSVAAFAGARAIERAQRYED